MLIPINGYSYELLILVFTSKKQTSSAVQISQESKQGFFPAWAAITKCSSLQPAALMDAALLSFPGDSSQHYSSFSRSNQSSRASSCRRLVYSLLWSNTGATFSLPHPHFLTHFFFFFGQVLHTGRVGIMFLARNSPKVTVLNWDLWLENQHIPNSKYSF